MPKPNVSRVGKISTLGALYFYSYRKTIIILLKKGKQESYINNNRSVVLKPKHNLRLLDKINLIGK